MLKLFLFVFKNLREGKGIPHGGLGTVVYEYYDPLPLEFPSYTVGIEPTVYALSHRIEKLSLHPTQWAWNGACHDNKPEKEEVAIPHGGLRTSNHHINQNKTYQSFRQGGTLFK
jgi:hypothetical protein